MTDRDRERKLEAEVRRLTDLAIDRWDKIRELQAEIDGLKAVIEHMAESRQRVIATTKKLLEQMEMTR